MLINKYNLTKSWNMWPNIPFLDDGSDLVKKLHFIVA